MKNGIALLTLIVTSIVLTSCKDDPPPKSKVGFEVAEMEIKESNGSITSVNPLIVSGGTGQAVSISIQLDRPVAETSVIAIEVSGTASAELTADGFNDYKFVSDDSNIIIQKGDDTAEIKLTIYEDYDFESDANDNLFETVEISLKSVVSGTALIDEEADTFSLKILEDDVVIILDWDDGKNGDNPRGDVDMDTYLFFGGDPITGSAGEGSDSFEGFNIPAYFDNGTYGLSCNYFSGTSDDLEFYTLFFNFGGTLNGSTHNTFDDPLQFVGNYDLDNINEYSDPSETKEVQTVTKNGFNYTNISQINEPTSGSRMGSLGSKDKLNMRLVSTKLSQAQIRTILSKAKK